MKTNKVAVGIVTYNRKKYLLEELRSLTTGSLKPNSIIVVDNCSSDGTPEMLGANSDAFNSTQRINFQNIDVFYIRNDSNYGGSRGFKQVFEFFLDNNCGDYLWVMDDDVLPQNNCLEELLKGFDDSTEVVCPTRIGDNFKETFITDYKINNIIGYTRKQRVCLTHEIPENGFIYVKFFPFEGPLFTKNIITKVGLPDESYYFQYDDGDYAIRCSKKTKIKYIANAILNRQIPVNFNTTFDENRYYYTLRNQVVFNKRYCKKIVYFFRTFIAIHIYFYSNLFRFRFHRIKISMNAIFDGIKGKLGKRE